jgi:nicotinate-nucleotide adenylyltransferase
MRMMPVAIVDRPGWRHRALAAKAAQAFRSAYVPESLAGVLSDLVPPAWTLLTGPLSDLSSTALRARLHAPSQAKPKQGGRRRTR